MAKRKVKGSTPHWHGCQKCHHRYEDSCEEKKTNALCVFCRGGKGWQLLRDNASPQDCCRIESRPPTKDEREKYRLEGSAIWFICAACKRSHPYDDPKRKKAS